MTSVVRMSGMFLLGGLAGCANLGRQFTVMNTRIVAWMSPNGAIVTFDRAFLEEHKNQITMTVTFSVDNAAKSPNPAILDGDLHIAGRAPEVGLRLVAEIINADADAAKAAIAAIHHAESTHVAVALTGVWRMWPEHALGPERQGQPMPELTSPNPDHLFEIHPVTRVGGHSLLGNFRPVEGYRPGNAARTFGIYQDATCELKVTPTRVTLETSNWVYNDVHFLMRPSAAAHQVTRDGRFITADALDTDGNLLVEGLRMILIEGTAPERAIRALPRGGRLHVWGLPRVSFAEISRRVRDAATNPALLKGSLPYEIIILGVYPDETPDAKPDAK